MIGAGALKGTAPAITDLLTGIAAIPATRMPPPCASRGRPDATRGKPAIGSGKPLAAFKANRRRGVVIRHHAVSNVRKGTGGRGGAATRPGFVEQG